MVAVPCGWHHVFRTALSLLPPWHHTSACLPLLPLLLLFTCWAPCRGFAHALINSELLAKGVERLRGKAVLTQTSFFGWSADGRTAARIWLQMRLNTMFHKGMMGLAFSTGISCVPCWYIFQGQLQLRQGWCTRDSCFASGCHVFRNFW